MFLDYYQLKEQPFAPLADAGQAFPSRAHSEALEALQDALLSGCGGVAVVAQSGAGKTTLLRAVYEQLREDGRATLLFRKECDSSAVLQFVLAGLGIECVDFDLASMLNRLNEVWFAQILAGKQLILMFDDAETLDDATLETIQLISKYETSQSKLFQIVLCGQPQLLKRLENGNFAQLRKRIVKTKNLEPLSPVETADYVRNRLMVAGHCGHSLFSRDAMTVIAELSHGLSENINKICSRALLEAYARGMAVVTADIVEKAERNLSGLTATDDNTLCRLGDTHSNAKPFVRVPTLMPDKPSRQFRLPSSTLWVGAAAGVLLSAGLVLPHALSKSTTSLVQAKSPVFAGSMQHEPSPQSISQPDHSSIHAQAKPAASPTINLSPSLPKREVAQIFPGTNTTQDARLSLTRELGLKINRIVIDPGHGGFDTGAKGPHGLLEKDICLDVALRLGQLIEQNIPGAEVVYTRKDDSHVPLEERTAIANGADADLFISIHANSSDLRDVRGVETYYLSLATTKEAKELAIRENALGQESLHDLPDLVKKITSNEKIAESKLLAAEIQDTLSRRLQVVSSHERNRGVKQAPFIVLTGANMPAVLSEISFVSNASDETLLLEGSQRERIADGLYRGISAYLDGLHGQPQVRQKLVTENRPGSPAFERAMAEISRRPL
jgi:N-acetylmuramoyl-L-alanine amidase